MNTDPWLFHPGFVWSVCRHGALTTEMEPGDIVLFGSTLGGEWILDTVLVIDGRMEGVQGKIGGIYDRLVLPTIPKPFHPFVGKPYRSFGDPFSFSPAMVADNGHKPFRRPTVNRLLSLLRKIKDGQPPSPYNAQALVICKSGEGVGSFWKAIVQEVEQAGLVLGTAFFHPSSLEAVEGGAIAAAPCREPGRRRPTRRCT